jgi:hypothetical protein
VIKKTSICLMVLVVALLASVNAEENSPSRIAWYGDLETGLAEAKRSGRPILLVSGAPHCLGVPGVW